MADDLGFVPLQQQPSDDLGFVPLKSESAASASPLFPSDSSQPAPAQDLPPQVKDIFDSVDAQQRIENSPRAHEVDAQAKAWLQKPLVEPQYIKPALRASADVLSGGLAEGYRYAFPNAYGGIEDSAANVASGFSSPANLGLLALFPEGKIPATVIGSYFEAEAIKNTPDLWKQYQASTDPREKVRLLSDMAVGLGLPLATLFHTAGKASEIAPSTPQTERPTPGTPKPEQIQSAVPQAIIQPSPELPSPEPSTAPRTVEASFLPNETAMPEAPTTVDEAAPSGQAEPSAPEAPRASVPFTDDISIPYLTKQRVLEQLRGAGYKDRELTTLTTDEVQRIISNQPDAPARAADVTPEEQARRQYEAEQRGELAAVNAEAKPSILTWLGENGGLPTHLGTERQTSNYRGELKHLYEMARGGAGAKGSFIGKIFNKDAPSIDRLALQAKADGFPIETPDDLIQAVDQAFREHLNTSGNVDVSRVDPLPEPQRITGISQRVHDQRLPTEIQPGEGVSARDMVNRGRQLIGEGVDPVRRMAEIEASPNHAISADDVALMRAHQERLAVDTTGMEDLARSHPTPENRAALKEAWKAEADWGRRVKALSTEAHKIFMAHQGGVDIDTGSFSSLRRAVIEEKGRDIKPEEALRLKEAAEKVQAANKSEYETRVKLGKEIDRLNAEVERAKKERARRPRAADKAQVMAKDFKKMSAEELRNHFAEKFKRALPC